jgi:xylan 1,4-beta-xylosidase
MSTTPTNTALGIRVDREAPGEPLVHHWSRVVGAGRAAEGLRAGWQEQLRTVVRDCGFEYVRFHGLFHDDMFVYTTDAEGRARYNFQYVDDLFDRLLDAGIRPFVELGFAPRDLARETSTVFWWQAHGAPPTDLTAWADLVRAIAAHWIERYGREEVRRWYFEVWNEPNLDMFFRGTKSEYFELYEATVRALREVDGELRVGGPATSSFVPDTRFAGETEDFTQHTVVLDADDLDALDWQPVWVADFLAHCHSAGLPVDFVSTHPYPTDWPLDGHGNRQQLSRGRDATPTDLATLRRLVERSPFPDAEIHLTEWSSSPSPRDHTHDHLQAATFVAMANAESTGLADSLAYWTFTDVFEEVGAGLAAFHGGFGMMTYQGIPKPTYHAYRMLHLLGDEVIGRGLGCLATRHRDSGGLAVLVYHYPPEATQSGPSAADPALAARTLATGTPRPLRVELTGLAPGAPVTVETLDREHGNARAAWEAMGAPASPSREQTVALRRAGAAVSVEIRHADDAGRLVYDSTLTPWSVVLLHQPLP